VPATGPAAAQTADQGAQPPQFKFDRFGVTRAVFQEVPKTELPEGEKPSGQLRSNLGVKVTVGPGHAEVRFGMTVLPDPRFQPYEIHVEVVGMFSTDNGTDEQLGDFCRANALAILFPYVRELINRISADGRYGSVRLNPANVVALLSESSWSTEPSLPH
jgi:preprotein translocase subunit SecB